MIDNKIMTDSINIGFEGLEKLEHFVSFKEIEQEIVKPVKQRKKKRMAAGLTRLNSRQELLLENLTKFYRNDFNRKIIVPIIKQETAISLRLLDWLVTNYSKKFNVHYELCQPNQEGYIPANKHFNLWLEYKNQLKAYSKRLCDPFCRRQRLFFNMETTEVILINNDDCKEYENSPLGILTTVGQLNFFRWAIANRVIDYAFDHLKEIESDMLKSADKRTYYKKCSSSTNPTNSSKPVEIEPFSDDDEFFEKERGEKGPFKKQLSKNNNSAKVQKLKIIVAF